MPSLTTKVAVFASPSRKDEMVEWLLADKNLASLRSNCSLLATKDLADKLLEAAADSSLLIESISRPSAALGSEPVDDILVANKVLSGSVQGIVIFREFTDSYAGEQISAVPPDLNLLLRACNAADIPLALNKASADLMLRGIAKTRVAYLIFNPVAGQGDSKTDLETIKTILEPSLILHIIMTEKDKDVAQQAREVVELIQSNPDYNTDDESPSKQPMILASGGDGTVAAIAGATMMSGVPFGAIPRGTANAFSVALGIPTDVAQACHNILRGNLRVTDGAKCNDMRFINLAGVGFEAGLVENATRELKNVLGNLAYVLGGAQQTIQQKPFSCRVQIDDQEKTDIKTKVITVANVAPPSSIFAQGFGKVIPDDGLFEVTINTGTGTLEELDALASLWASSVVKSAVPSNNVLRVRAKKITVEFDEPNKLLLDGEVLDIENSVTFENVPGALMVIAPDPAEQN